MSDDEALPCPMRRLGASRMPAWAVAEFAGAEACAALCLASREWDAAVASSPLWAARVRRTAPLTFHALCAARHPMAAAESVARIPFDRDAPFALEFAPAQPGQRRASVTTVEDLDSVFFHYALARSTDSAAKEYKALHSPLLPEAGDKRAKFFRENPGGPLLSQFGTWRFVGCNVLSSKSCAGVAGIIEDDLEYLYKK